MRARSMVLTAALLAAGGSLAAQVGHPPESSPYRDLRARHAIMLTGGYLAGSSGRLGIGPADGEFGGIRYDLAIGGPTDAVFGLSYARLNRLVVDPGAAPDTRVSGPVTQSVAMVDAGLNILLTGRKTWRGLAPFIGAGLGLAFGGSVPQDSSGFSFNTKFFVGPAAGVRWYPTQHVTFRVEGRDLFWQIKYPASFFSDPVRAPGTTPALDRATDPDSEWLQHPTLIVALGYAFRF